MESELYGEKDYGSLQVRETDSQVPDSPLGVRTELGQRDAAEEWTGHRGHHRGHRGHAAWPPIVLGRAHNVVKRGHPAQNTNPPPELQEEISIILVFI